MFSNQPTEAVLPNKILVQILVNLKEVPVSSIATCAYWMQALVDAHICLAERGEAKNDALLHETFGLFQKFFNQGDESLCHTLHLSMKRLIERCIQESPAAAMDCMEVLDKCLNIQNANVWKYILQLMSTLVEVSGVALLGDGFRKVLQTLVALREREDCFCGKEIDRVNFQKDNLYHT